MFIDSHAHLTSGEFENDREEVIQRARDAGVDCIVNPATTLDDSRKALELAEKHAGLFACVGVHPHEAATADDRTLREVEELLAHPKVVAVGEIGLDFHYDMAPRDVQERAFRAQLEMAVRHERPVVLHTRNSMQETVGIIEHVLAGSQAWRSHFAFPESRYPGPRGVFHCFSGDVEMAWRVIKLGFFVSFPGILTFKNATTAASVASNVSLEHFLLETDSPYLAPVPHRGKRNEPAYLPLIAEKLAELQGLSVSDVARSTRYAANRLFGVGEPPAPTATYTLRDSLYVNLTLRCNADCVFCDRKGEAVIKGHNLRIEREPSAAEVIAEIGDPAKYNEIVFCGYGEPTIRLDVVMEVARWVKAHGGRTRLNTDGHGNLIHKRNIIPELVGVIDAVSISLNSADPEQYGQLMRLNPEQFYPAMLDFARECVRVFPQVMMTIVAMDGVDRERARVLVEEEIGAVFVPRPYF